MCLAFFEGKGYSGTFTAHTAALLSRLEEEDPPVRIVLQADEVCAACPNNEAGVCRTAEKVERYDRAVLALCGLSDGAELRWSDFACLVRRHVLDAGKRACICGDCEWNDVCTKHADECGMRHDGFPLL